MRRSLVLGIAAIVMLVVAAPAYGVLPTEDAQELPTQGEFTRVDKARKSTAYWPDGTITTPQFVQVKVQAPGAIRGTYFLVSGLDRAGAQRGPYEVDGTMSWEATFVPNSGGVMNALASVFVRRDSLKYPRGSKIPKGKMRCQIFVNGNVVSSVSIDFDEKTSSIHCNVTGKAR
jgi:hypothetical protein